MAEGRLVLGVLGIGMEKKRAGRPKMKQDLSQKDQPPLTPSEMTVAGWDFWREYSRLLGLMAYVAKMATSIDETARVSRRALAAYQAGDVEKYHEDDPEGEQRIKERGAITALRKWHGPLLVEMMLCRGTDNFLTYVAELLSLVFHTRPETLRSSEMVGLETILNHRTMDELVSFLAEQRVNRLSYKGMADLSEYLSERLAFDLFPNPDGLEQASRIVELRNLIVHNRGIVNARFLSRTRDTSASAGQALNLDSDRVLEDLKFLALSVNDADARAVEKFGLLKTTTASGE